jgi:hypothetical protein
MVRRRHAVGPQPGSVPPTASVMGRRGDVPGSRVVGARCVVQIVICGRLLAAWSVPSAAFAGWATESVGVWEVSVRSGSASLLVPGGGGLLSIEFGEGCVKPSWQGDAGSDVLDALDLVCPGSALAGPA